MRRKCIGLNGREPRWVTNTNGQGRRLSRWCWWRLALECGHEVFRAAETPPQGHSYDCHFCDQERHDDPEPDRIHP